MPCSVSTRGANGGGEKSAGSRVWEFEKRWGRYARRVHSSWRMDETSVSVPGSAHYLYRAVDKCGKTVDSLLCVDHSDSPAQAFFNKALKTHQAQRPRR
jgi:IS6 family transposase